MIIAIAVDASRVNISERTGTENYSYHLIQHLSRIDTKNHYTLYFRRPPNKEFFTKLTTGNPNFTYKVLSWPRLWTQAGLALECLLNPPDILFVPAHTLPIIRRPKVKTVVTLHDVGFSRYQRFLPRLYLDYSSIWAARLSTKIIAVSQSTKNDIIAKLGVNDEKVEVVYEGVNAKIFYKAANNRKKIEQICHKYGLKDYILFVSTIQPRKNLERMFEAFKLFLQKYPDYKFAVVGKKGWSYERIINKPKELGIENDVKFLGRVSDTELPYLYAGASVLSFTTLYEGFGLPILESMAAGTPVVTSNVSSCPEVAGNAAILVDPYNVGEIATGYEKILTNGKLRERLVRDGLNRVKMFTWEQTAQKTLKVFESL